MSDQLPVWAEIDLSAIAHNCREVRRSIPQKSRFMAVVKANAYGHGAAVVARTALANGADSLAVARIDEALALRRAGITAPILVFGPIPVSRLPEAVEWDLILTIHDIHAAKEASRLAQFLGLTLKAHLKVDTGMGRLGLVAVPEASRGRSFAPQAAEDAATICRLPHLDIQGVYTHFAQADSADKAYTESQLACFLAFLNHLEIQGIRFPLRHAANSAAVIDVPAAHLDLVRPGLMLYGIYPSPEVDHQSIRLKPAMSLKCRITQIKDVAPGFKISYGSTFQTIQPTRIATVPVGYADGYSRTLSSRAEMLVRGKRAPVVGRICMDQTMLDVGHVEGASVGDGVLIFGGQSPTGIPVEEIAEACSTIPYETVASLAARVPRVYSHES